METLFILGVRLHPNLGQTSMPVPCNGEGGVSSAKVPGWNTCVEQHIFKDSS